MLTAQDMQIADDRLQGNSLQSIAIKQGFDTSTACRKLQKPELKEYLENIQKNTIQKTAAIAADNLIHVITNYKDNPCDTDKQRIEKSHGFKASERIAESIGILPSRAESSVVVNILNQGSMAISKDILGILAGLLPAQELPDLGIDGEIIDVQTSNKD